MILSRKLLKIFLQTERVFNKNGENKLIVEIVKKIKNIDELLIEEKGIIQSDIECFNEVKYSYIDFSKKYYYKKISENPLIKSKFKYVIYHRPTMKWKACPIINGKPKHIGYFKTQEEAQEKIKSLQFKLAE